MKVKSKKTYTPKTITPKISVASAEKIASVSSTLENLICELIDNTIQNDKPKNPTRVDVKLHYNRSDSYIQILDNSIGIPEYSIPDALNYSGSVNAGKLRLSQMGMGMKIAIGGLGKLDYIITKTKNNPAYIVTVGDYTNPNEILTFKIDEYIGNEFPYDSGTLIRIKEAGNMVRNWASKNYFDAFCSKIESTYPYLLNEYLNIDITYTKSKGEYWNHSCIAYKPLMSHPEQIINDQNGLGKNTPILDRKLINVEGFSDVRAYLTCWHKPHPLIVAETYNKTKDEAYNPTKYANSPWYYGEEFSGIALGMRGKILEWNFDKKSSRNERHGILLEVEEGLDYTALKSGVKRTNKWDAILKAVDIKLQEIEFYVRSTAMTPAITEEKYMTKFFDKLKTDDTTRRAYNVKDYDKQVRIKPSCGVGEPDGIIFDFDDPSKVIWVIEGKKDRGSGSEARQLVGYMAHYNCYNGIFVSPVKNPQFDQQIQDFNKFLGQNLTISNIDVAWVNSLQFFAI
jgi:hypothetical protein